MPKHIFRRLFSNPSIVILALVISLNHSTAQNSAKMSFKKGFHLLTIDKHEAIKHLTEAIRLDSSNAESYYYRALVQYKLEENEKAIVDFNKALHYDSSLSVIHIYKGFAYRNLGDINQAVEEFNTYLDKNPSDTSAYSLILRGKWKQQSGNYSGAIEDYNMAVALKPIEEKYYYYRFLSMYNKQNYKMALKEIDKVISLNPEFYGYQFYKGNTLFHLKLYKEAILLYNKSLVLNDYNSDAYFQRGLAFEQLDNFKEAIESYNMAIIMNSHDGVYYSKRGNSKYEYGDKIGACDDWDHANTLGYYEDYEKMKKLCD